MATSHSADDVASAVLSVIRGHLELHHALAARLGLNPSDLAALLHVGAAGELQQEHLRARLRMSKGAMTVLVDRLEEAGLLERRPNPADRRSVLLAATERTAAVRGARRTELRERLVAMADRLEAADRATVIGFLTDVLAELEAVTGDVAQAVTAART